MNMGELKIHFDSQPNLFKLSWGPLAICIMILADDFTSYSGKKFKVTEIKFPQISSYSFHIIASIHLSILKFLRNVPLSALLPFLGRDEMFHLSFFIPPYLVVFYPLTFIPSYLSVSLYFFNSTIP